MSIAVAAAISAMFLMMVPNRLEKRYCMNSAALRFAVTHK
jgi:peptide methionine sulfoxide reductase MsrB